MNKFYIDVMKRRQKLSYTQSYMGYKMGLSQKQYCRIEAGKSQIKLKHFLKLSLVLEIHPCVLLCQSGLADGLVPCEKTAIIDQQKDEIQRLEKRNKLLESILEKLTRTEEVAI
jgi:predicted transcriptional regulator